MMLVVRPHAEVTVRRCSYLCFVTSRMKLFSCDVAFSEMNKSVLRIASESVANIRMVSCENDSPQRNR